MLRVIALFLLVLLSGCDERPAAQVHFDQGRDHESPFPLSPTQQFTALRANDPIDEARQAFRMRDYRLVGLSGMVIDVPGLANRADLRAAVAVKLISGTGGGHNSELEELAERYARSYNLEMLRLLTNRK